MCLRIRLTHILQTLPTFFSMYPIEMLFPFPREGEGQPEVVSPTSLPRFMHISLGFKDGSLWVIHKVEISKMYTDT